MRGRDLSKKSGILRPQSVDKTLSTFFVSLLVHTPISATPDAQDMSIQNTHIYWNIVEGILASILFFDCLLYLRVQ